MPEAPKSVMKTQQIEKSTGPVNKTQQTGETLGPVDKTQRTGETPGSVNKAQQIGETPRSVDKAQQIEEAPKPVIKTKQTGDYLKSLSDRELVELCVGPGYSGLGYNVTPTAVGRTSISLLKKGIPNINFSDGPAGLNLCPKNA